ncbi:MAG: nitroreductase family protein [Bacteroidales bacterium]|nr:nitroreductase family protein [Bacteroidales bacterium]
MEFLKGIQTRRSIRAFTNQPVTEENIRIILETAMMAPSAVNCQPWHFIVIRNKEAFRKIMNVHPYATMLSTAQAAILVCGDKKLQHDDGYWIMDCSAATENLLLAAHALGIGSVWIGVHPRESRKKAMRQLFNLPEHIEPLALVALGYPAETPDQPTDRYKPDRIHFETW